MGARVDQALFERLLEPHLDRLYGLAWRLAGNKADAEDLFQDLLVKVYGKLEALSDIDEPGPWLSRVMYNLFIDQQRRRKRRRLHVVSEAQLPGVEIAQIPGSENPVADRQRMEKLERLDAALRQLSDDHRIVVLLHDTDGYKISEIQALTGLPEGTIKSRLHRARARLRDILVADGTFSRATSFQE